MDKITNARRLRRDQTLAERTLWTLVRNRRLGGFKFLRQVAIARYFADFVCEAAKIIVELDGPVHDGREDYDARRTETLGVVRIYRCEVLQRAGPCRSGRNGERHPSGASIGENVTSHPPTASRRAPPSLKERGLAPEAGVSKVSYGG